MSYIHCNLIDKPVNCIIRRYIYRRRAESGVKRTSIVLQALASLRREINYKAFLQRGYVSLPHILLSLSLSLLPSLPLSLSPELTSKLPNGCRFLRVSQTRLYKSVSPVIKRKYTREEAKDNASVRRKYGEMKNFRTSARDLLFLDFPTRIHFPFS